VIAGLLLLLGGLVWGVMDRWEPDPGQLPPVRLEPGEGWRVRGGGGGAVEWAAGQVTLSRSSRSGTTAVSRILQLGFGPRAFELEADVALRDVVAGEGAPDWLHASVGLMGRHIDGGYDTGRPFYLMSGRGTVPLQTYRARLQLAGEATRGVLFIRLREVSGEMTVSGLRVTPLRERRAYVLAAGLGGAAWSLALLAGASRLVGSADNRPAALAVIAILGAALALGLWPQETLAPLHRIARMVAQDPEAGLGWLEAGLHGLGFAGLAFALRRARPHDPWGVQLGALLALGVGSELIQGYAGELGIDDLADAGVNASGAILGTVLARARPGKRGLLPES
jgi:hypothetical protein